MDVRLWSRGENTEATVHRSKAVGEPPFMLAVSVHQALADAVSSIGDYARVPQLDSPATPEAILAAVHAERALTADTRVPA